MPSPIARKQPTASQDACSGQACAQSQSNAGTDGCSAINGTLGLRPSELQRICLIHLISGVDEDAPEEMTDNAMATLITGYTEWIGEGDPELTIGWDWKMTCDASRVQLVRASDPCSNVAIHGDDGSDLGPTVAARYLASKVDDFNWQDEALQYINIRYQN